MKGLPNVWLKAFKTFYSPQDPTASQDVVARFLFSARIIILVISAQAAIIAGKLLAAWIVTNAIRIKRK